MSGFPLKKNQAKLSVKGSEEERWGPRRTQEFLGLLASLGSLRGEPMLTFFKRNPGGASTTEEGAETQRDRRIGRSQEQIGRVGRSQEKP